MRNTTKKTSELGVRIYEIWKWTLGKYLPPHFEDVVRSIMEYHHYWLLFIDNYSQPRPRLREQVEREQEGI